MTRNLEFPLRGRSGTTQWRPDSFRRFESTGLLRHGIQEEFLLGYHSGYEGMKVLRNVGHGETPQTNRIQSNWRLVTTTTIVRRDQGEHIQVQLATEVRLPHEVETVIYVPQPIGNCEQRLRRHLDCSRLNKAKLEIIRLVSLPFFSAWQNFWNITKIFNIQVTVLRDKFL